ncbi:MAG: MATE family efflux transporter [Ruminococcaceae bacterium]|nr:MATE family efflux transporter [Oscillospiraceae bacterium]
MDKRIQVMTEGRSVPLLLRFALPLMLGNVFQQLYTMVDTAVVGKALGVGALAALGAADWLGWMMLSVIQGLTHGASILMAREFGAGRYDRLRKTVGNAALLAVLAAALLVTLGEGLLTAALRLLHTPGEILSSARLYLRIIFAGIPAVMAFNFFAATLRALGDGKTPLLAMIVASFVNITLDLLFVLVFRWGIAGAAIATVLAQVLSSLYCLRRLRGMELLRLGAADFRADFPLLRQILGLSWPLGLQNVMISVGGMVVQSVVNGFGVSFIAGFTATNKLYGLLELAATSYGYAVTTFVSQNLGAGKTGRIRSGVRAANVVSLLTSLLIAAAMLLFGRAILSCFISGTVQEVADTMAVAYHYLSIMSVCLPILYYLHVTRSALQGLGNTLLPMLSGVLEFVMRVFAALALPRFVGESGIFYAEVLAWLGADAVLALSWLALAYRLREDNHVG